MFKLNSIKQDLEDGGEGGGAGSAQVPDHTQQVELLTKTVGLLAEGLQKMEGTQSDIVSALAKITEQSKGEVKEQLEEKFGEGLDLETLDRKQFAQFIMESTVKAIRGEMQKTLAGVDEKVTDLASSFETKNAHEQIEKTAEKNADFWEWSSEIKQILAENPSLSVTRAYNLAKSEHPDKVKDLDKKYNKSVKKEHSFIGLTPTSNLGTREGTGKMSSKEAAEKAFDEVMGRLGDVIQTGDMKLA